MMFRHHWHVVEDGQHIMCFVQLGRMKIRLTCSSYLVSAKGYGLICKLIGPWKFFIPDLLGAKQGFGRLFFSEVVLLASWHIWLLRNGFFSRGRPFFAPWCSNFVHDMTLLAHRIKACFEDRLIVWISLLHG